MPTRALSFSQMTASAAGFASAARAFRRESFPPRLHLAPKLGLVAASTLQVIQLEIWAAYLFHLFLACRFKMLAFLFVSYFAIFQQSQADNVLESKIVPLRMASSTSVSERTTG